MLMLSRNTGEAVDVMVNGEKCRLLITSVRGDRVRIGFDAPKHWRIMRTELDDESKEGVSPLEICRAANPAERSDVPSESSQPEQVAEFNSLPLSPAGP